MRDGRGLTELIFVILIILIISGFFAVWLLWNLDEARKVALENQLTNLKISLELFRITEGYYPEDLRELNKRYHGLEKDSLYKRSYLEYQNQDTEGYPVDPYGRRFIYDKKTGRVGVGYEKKEE